MSDTIQRKGNLTLHCKAGEHRERDGYAYGLLSKMSPYKAFRTRAALEHFLTTHGLELAEDLPQADQHAFIAVTGEVLTCVHGDIAELPAEGKPVLFMDCAEYTLGMVAPSPDGPVLHYVNVNAPRVVFDPARARAFEDAGHSGDFDLL